jgi:hypothetical protein
MNASESDSREAQLRERERHGWDRVKEALEAVGPIVCERVTRRVRAHVPDAAKLLLEPSDQGGGGWVLQATLLADGSRLSVDDPRGDALSDDDELSILLLDFGELVSSESEPYPYEFALDRDWTDAPPAPMAWDEFWRLVYRPAGESGEQPTDGENALSAADTCMELYSRFAPDPGVAGSTRRLTFREDDAK